jgi:hypothetical protein
MLKTLQNEGEPVKLADEKSYDDSDFDRLYADLRWVTLDALATWLGYWETRADRIQVRLETRGVSNEILDAATNEGQAILRFLAAVGRTR